MDLRRSALASACALIIGCGSAHAASLILNGGFDLDASGTHVPTDWTASAAYNLNANFNKVTDSAFRSSPNSLQDANTDSQSTADLFQTFSDVNNQLYTVSFYLRNNGADAGSYFTASAGGVSKTYLPGDADFDGNWIAETFNFTGHGSDTLTIGGVDSPAFWYVDDVSVTAAVAATPLPATLPMLAGGAGLFGFFASRKARKKTAA